MLFGEPESTSISDARSPVHTTSVPTGPQPTEVAYLAGFFDGEGSIGITGGSLCARISNTYRPILERFQKIFGGTISVHSMGDEKSRLSWVWTSYGDTAQTALEILEPYLVEKRTQAFIGLLYRRTPKGPDRVHLKEALSLLKKTTHHHRTPRCSTPS
jgi:hypothetical protein